MLKRNRNRKILVAACMAISLFSASGSAVSENRKLQAAEFTADGQLIRPENIDQWIFLGAAVGHGYPDDESRAFSLNSPGMIQIVQMEPGAYRHLKQHGNYADGTMLSLSFYNTQEKPSPAVDGVVQKDLASFEIHILDREKYSDKRAFFLFQNGDNTAGMIPKGNACVGCHEKDAGYDGTFVQFYPVLRDRLLPGGL